MTIALLAFVGLVAGLIVTACLRGRRYAAETPAHLHPAWLALLPIAGAVFVPLAAARASSSIEVALAMVFVTGALPALWIDLDVHRLPDWLTLPMAGSLAVIIIGGAAVTGEWSNALRALLGAAAAGLLFLALAVFSTLGLGDVKLILSIGLLLGYVSWPCLFLGVFSGYLIGALWAVVMLLRGRSRKDHLPFGPALIVGALTSFGLHVV